MSDWPYQRYGHTVVSKGNTCYLFGGRNDEAACNLLFTFCAKSYRWRRPVVQGDIPGERDGHSAAIVGNYMYVFGGYEESYERFGQDIYRLDLETYTWKLMVGRTSYHHYSLVHSHIGRGMSRLGSHWSRAS